MMGGSVVCFNPTLVRLRLYDPAKRRRLHLLFQSHAGSIEAGKVPELRYCVGEVSIPRWFD